jgi:hypothetical protein
MMTPVLVVRLSSSVSARAGAPSRNSFLPVPRCTGK